MAKALHFHDRKEELERAQEEEWYRRENERVERNSMPTEGEIRDKKLDAVRTLEIPPELKAPVPFRAPYEQPPLELTEAQKQDSEWQQLQQ